MATNTWADLNIKEAERLADLTGIRYDLQSAQDMAQTLKEEHASEKPNWRVRDALSTAILVRYSRAFVTGVRARLGDDVLAPLTDEQRTAHAHLRAFRDKHIAHSVNAFEENQPIARYWLERVKEEGITSIECNHARIVGLGTRDLDNVIELTTLFIEFVDARLTEEKARLLGVVRSMPLEQVLAGGQRAFIPDQDAVAKRRTK